MKNSTKFFTLFFLSFFAMNVTFANSGTPSAAEKLIMIDNEIVSFNYTVDVKTYFENVSCSDQNEYLSLKTFKNVELIQIFDEEGELEFQIPVNNNEIHVSLSDFSKGDYLINLKFENEDTFVSTDMTKK